MHFGPAAKLTFYYFPTQLINFPHRTKDLRCLAGSGDGRETVCTLTTGYTKEKEPGKGWAIHAQCLLSTSPVDTAFCCEEG